MIKFKFGAMVVLAMVLAISCENELQEPVKVQDELLLTEAKDWFEASYQKAKIKDLINPRWDKAIVVKNSIEMPYTVDGKLQLPHSEYALKKQGRKRILIHKNTKGISAHVVSYIPSDKFEGDIKKINAWSFKSQNFDGRITIQQLGSDFLQEFLIQNGEIVIRNKHDDYSISNGRTKEWFEQCTDWYLLSGGEWGYIDTTCNTWWEANLDPFLSQYDPTWPYYADYGGGSGSGGTYYVNNTYWLTCIQNQLQNPCLSNTADKVLDPNLASTYNNLIQDIFNSSDQVNLILQEGNLPNAIANTVYNSQNGYINVVITLDPSDFVGSSQEYIGAAIYHECFHAIVDYLSNNNVPADDQHIAMYTAYLNMLAESLQAQYPNMMPGDAKGLILKGLINLDGGENPPTSYWTTAFVDKVLNSSGFSRTQLDLIYRRYQIVHTSGTPC